MAITYNGQDVWKEVLVIPEGSDPQVFTGYLDVLFKDLADRATHLRELIDANKDGIADYLKEHQVEGTSAFGPAVNIKASPSATDGTLLLRLVNQSDTSLVEVDNRGGMYTFRDSLPYTHYINGNAFNSEGSSLWQGVEDIAGMFDHDDSLERIVTSPMIGLANRVKLFKVHVYARGDVTGGNSPTLKVAILKVSATSAPGSATIPTSTLVADTSVSLTDGQYVLTSLDVSVDTYEGDGLYVRLKVNNDGYSGAVKVAWVAIELLPRVI